MLGFRFQVDQPTSKLLQFATKYKLDSFYKATTPGSKISQVQSPGLSKLIVICFCAVGYLLYVAFLVK